MDERFKRIIGMRVRASRQLKGLTQEDLAGRIKRSPMSVSKIERGIQLPDLTTLIAIADALNVPLTSFVEETSSHHGKPLRRQKLEMRLAKLVQELSDNHLSLAIEHVEVLVRNRGKLKS